MTEKAFELGEAYDRLNAIQDVRDEVTCARLAFVAKDESREKRLNNLLGILHHELYKCMPLDSENAIPLHKTAMYTELEKVIHFMQLTLGGDDKIAEVLSAVDFFRELCDAGIRLEKNNIKNIVGEL